MDLQKKDSAEDKKEGTAKKESQLLKGSGTSEDTPPPFKPDNGVAYLSLAGVVGFFFGCVILFFTDFKCPSNPKSVFHEIQYDPRPLADTVIKNALDTLTAKFENLKKEINAYPKQAGPDSLETKAQLIEKRKADSIIIQKLNAYHIYYKDTPASDSAGFTELNKVLHFDISQQTLRDWTLRFQNDSIFLDTLKVPYYFKDRNIPVTMADTANFIPVKAYSDVAFITKYPSAGVWVLLIILFCSFCFIASLLAWHLAKQVNKHVGITSSKHYLTLSIITLVIMGLIALLWKLTFFDDSIVRNLYFFQNITPSMNTVIGIGTITGALCLAGFIYTASVLKDKSDEIRKSNINILETKKAIQSNLIAQNIVAAIPPATQALKLQVQEDDNAKQKETFEKLSKIFRGYFFITSTILSLMVLCTATLFTTINSLDFTRLLISDWGYSPVRNDFVYLYGGVYTILMLLVYLPAKLRLAEADIWSDSPANANVPGMKNPLTLISGVLVASAPLLVSVLQFIFDSLINAG